MEKYLMYLRKSRSDSDYDSGAEEDVLKRHEEQLYRLADKMKISPSQIEVYREIVSADTIEQRPMMQKLLTRIESGDIKGVFVIEVERLARGDTMDQGKVARAFKLTNTLIITLNKIYNPNNEFDEEYFEFGLFMSRRELKTIKSRLNRGRRQSVLEGKFVASHTPFGYDKEKLHGEKGYKLIINEAEADTVKMVFNLFTEEKLGTLVIARRLNALGLKPRIADRFTAAIVRDILNQRVYIGELTWERRKGKKTIKDGEVTETHPVSENYIVAKGLHEPIISREQFEKAQELRGKGSRCPRCYAPKNPLAGLIKCGYCGRNMQRRLDRGQHEFMLCYTPECKNVSSYSSLIEQRILDIIKDEIQKYNKYITDYAGAYEQAIDNSKKQLETIDKSISGLHKQLEKICESYERGIYTAELFRQRNKVITEHLQQLEAERTATASLTPDDKMEEYKKRIPVFNNVLETYTSTSDITQKNKILKSIISHAVYIKTQNGRHDKSKMNEFSLNIFFKDLAK